MKGRLIATAEARMLYQEIDTVVWGLDHVEQTLIDFQNMHVGQLQVAIIATIFLLGLPYHAQRAANKT